MPPEHPPTGTPNRDSSAAEVSVLPDRAEGTPSAPPTLFSTFPIPFYHNNRFRPQFSLNLSILCPDVKIPRRKESGYDIRDSPR